ncbi:MAG: hypothetical protein O2871_00320 [bacterium]|nr:hypothetical protein [bacterium]
MFRVAGVASVICENFKQPELINQDDIVSACLLHDMGNIIKFDLSLFPQFLEPEGYDYWKRVHDEFINKYGSDEHMATYEIAKEIRVSKAVQQMIELVGFSNSEKNYNSTNFNYKIAAYADFRVAPLGVDSLENRLKDGRERFFKNKMRTYNPKLDKFDELSGFIFKLEEQIFEKSRIKLFNITERLVTDKFDEIKKLQLSLEF